MRIDSPDLLTDDSPIDSPERLLRLIAAAVREGIRDQCWLFFLDHERQPVRVVIPITDIPAVLRDDEIDLLAERFGDITRAAGGEHLALCWERPGDPDATGAEHRRAAGVARACAERGVPLAGQFLAHDEGVSPLLV